MTTFILQCGASIVGNLMSAAREPWKGPPADTAKRAGARLKAWVKDREWPGNATARDWEAVGEGWPDLVAQLGLVQDGHPLDLRAASIGISAERSGLGAPGAPRFDPDEDQVVLLASDTVLGILSAHLNAVSLGRRARYFTAPSAAWNWRPDARSALVVRVPELRLDHPTGLDDAAASLAIALRLAHRIARDRDDRLVVHVAGGFKASIPVLVALAEHLPLRPEVQVWCKHEEGSAALRVPIRRPSRGAWPPPELRADLEAASRGQTAMSGLWEGFAYRTQGARCEPTSLGRALYALFRAT